MKKLVIAAASLMVAIAANAATVTWTATKVYQPGTTTAAAGYIGYLFDADVFSTTTISAAILDGTFANAYSAQALASANTTTAGVISKTGIGNYGNTASTQNPEIVKTFTVLFDASTVATASNYIVTDVTTTTFTSGTGAKPAAFANIGTTYQWAEIGSVPEPTSGLLLLLGMAGLALKRKQA